MEKHSKHESPSSSSSSGASTSHNREGKLCSPTVQCMGKPIDNPLIKYSGCKWEQVFEFDKILKQIRNAERYYLRGREQPQVQRLSSNDMHFYGMVPKQPFDVVVCDKCLGIYTKMGFNNHMKLHHAQAWNQISSKAMTTKDSGSDNVHDNLRDISAIATTSVTATSTIASGSTRHKSSKSSNSGSGGGGGGSSGGSSRSRSKSKHHHHHHQQQQQQQQQQLHQRSSSASAAIRTPAPHTSQTSTTNTEVPASGARSSKKASSGVSSATISVPKEIQQPPEKPTIPTIKLPSSNLSEQSGNQAEIAYPSTIPATKEKPKASKRKSKNISAPLLLPPPEPNESSNSSVEYTAAMAAPSNVAIPSKSSSSKRSKSKGGKDLKQLMEPQQLSELDKAISSITKGQSDEASNSNENDCEAGSVATTSIAATPSSSLGYNTEDKIVSVPMQVPTLPQQEQHAGFSNMQVLSENTASDVGQQRRNANAEDNDNSILTLEDMLDSKFIHAILNTDESEIHFDESELDKAAQQPQPQQQHQQPNQQEPTFVQPTVSKRMRYDDNVGNVENVVQQQQSTLPGKYTAFQQQQQHQQQQQAFHIANLEDIKMYTSALDARQYLSQDQQQHQEQQQQQHQITTIDPMQLQQLLYQQQQQQYIGSGLEGITSDGLEQQQQQHCNDSDVIMCSAEQLHKEGKINAADYATLAALSGNNNSYGTPAPNNMCDVNAIDADMQFQVYNVPSLTDDDDVPQETNKLSEMMMPQNHYVLPAEGNNEEQLIYEITGNNQVAVISQQRQQQMIAEFLTQAGYDSVDNANINVSLNPMVVATEDSTANEIKNDMDAKINELLDFDFSRLDTVKSCSSSSSSSSADSKSSVKSELNKKSVSSSSLSSSSINIADELFVNVFFYAGLPRPLALNDFGLCKLPQGVATTFRTTLHATRKANNSPVSLNGIGGAASVAATRFSSHISNVKPTVASQNYFTALGANTNVGGNLMNEFSIGSITITNQGHQMPNSVTTSQQQQQQQYLAQKQTQSCGEYGNTSHVNGLIANANTISPRSVPRPKSAGSANSCPSKQKYGSNSSLSLLLPQNQAKTIVVNTNNVSAINCSSDQNKFVKRSMISKIKCPSRSYTNLTAKQLSDILLHPSKDKYMQLLGAKDIDKESLSAGLTSAEQQRLNNVRQFYERRKRLLNVTNGEFDHRQREFKAKNSLPPLTAIGQKQKFLRQRLLRTLSDCGINSIKNNNSSANNNNSNNDILRVS